MPESLPAYSPDGDPVLYPNTETWVDEDGVRHYAGYAPDQSAPPDPTIVAGPKDRSPIIGGLPPIVIPEEPEDDSEPAAE